MNKGGETLLKAVRVRKTYETPAGPLEILKGVDLSITRGEMAFVVGKSGSGKSTLLHLLGGLDTATSGELFFRDEEITQMPEDELARFRNAHLGFVFQFYHLLPELTVYENVLLPMMIAGIEDSKWAREIMKRIKIWSRKDHYPSELSGGEKQRVAIARALVQKPEIVLCDEPTGNLDEESSASVQELLTELNKSDGQAFLIVTHDESWAYRFNRVFRLTEGVLASDHHTHVPVEKIL
ncbi:MAG: ABC transporter ATP-binding protein [Candidatus Omnitrophota bacterium]